MSSRLQPGTRRFGTQFRIRATLALVSLICLAGMGTGARSVFFPVPVKTDAATGKPTAEVKLGWDASLSDLMAADAYAQCAVASTDPTTPEAANIAGNDEYLEWLRNKMGQTACHDPNGGNTIESKWVFSRTQRADCNADPYTLSPGTIPGYDVAEKSYASLGSTSLADLHASGLISSGNDAAALFYASREIRYAQLNLCMALRLRQQLETADAFFASSAEHTNLVGLTQERAELAVASFSLLAKVIGSPDPTSGYTISNAEAWFPILRVWAKLTDKRNLTDLGNDFALAIKLHIESTELFSRELQHQASARKDAREIPNRAKGDWGTGSPRVRLLNLLYGGDALGAVDRDLPGRSRGGLRADRQEPTYVATPSQDLRAKTLRQIAFALDLLNFRIVTQGTQTASIDRPASAKALYNSIESELRTRSCEEIAPGRCDHAQIRAQVELDSDLSRFELFRQYGIERSHAESIVGAFSDAFSSSLLGPAPVDRLYEGPFHLRGKVTQTTDAAGASWLHFGKDFNIVPFVGNELGAPFQSLYYLTRVPDFSLPGNSQGFVSAPPGRQDLVARWRSLRDMGAIPVLAYAHEALLSGANVLSGSALPTNPSASEFFKSAWSALDQLHAAIGITSVIVRPRLKNVFPLAQVANSMATGSPGNGGLGYDLDVTTLGGTDYSELALLPYTRHMVTTAKVPEAEILGSSLSALSGAHKETAQTSVFDLNGNGLELHHFSFWANSLNDGATQLFLVSQGGSGPTYLPAFRSGLSIGQGYYFSLGGTLNSLAEQTWAVLPDDWSRPMFDALGKRTDEFPPANAALIGGTANEESYQFYLKSARLAAQAATDAVQATLGGLSAAAIEERTTTAENTRDEGLAQLDLQSLCGTFPAPSLACKVNPVGYRRDLVAKSPCNAALDGNPALQQTIKFASKLATYPINTPLLDIAKATCNQLIIRVDTALPALMLPGQLIDTKTARLTADPPMVQAELGELLTNSWSAGRTLDLTLDSTIQQAASLATQVAIAYGAADLAYKEWFDRDAEITRALGCDLSTQSCDKPQAFQCNGAFADNLNQLNQLCGQQQSLDSSENGAEGERNRWCGEPRKDEADKFGLKLTFTRTRIETVDDPKGYRDCVCAIVKGNCVVKRELNLKIAAGKVMALKETLEHTNMNSTKTLCRNIVCTYDKDGLVEGCNASAPSENDPEKPAGGGCPGLEIPDTTCDECPNDQAYRDTAGTSGCSRTYNTLTPETFDYTDFSAERSREVRCEDASTVFNALQAGNKPIRDGITNLQQLLIGEVSAAQSELPAQRQIAEAEYSKALNSIILTNEAVDSQFSDQLVQLGDAAGSVHNLAAGFANLESRAQSITARTELADASRRAVASARYGLRNTFQSGDIWRAQALLANARQLSLAARRAIEARFVVDLSEIHETQAFVAAPALWADDVFESDLDAPSVVGLSLAPKSQSGVYANKLVDYVTNLERFVEGYSASYPTSQVTGDVEVVTLPAPAGETSALRDGQTVTVFDAASSGWGFHCPLSNSDWITHPVGTNWSAGATLKTACQNVDGSTSAPTEARYYFHLDPWGRRIGSLSNPPYTQRYNVRWGGLAVNLTGTGVRSCSRAGGPEACSVRYRLAHIGPTTTLDFQGRWRQRSIPTGYIEGGRALATEVQLDPLAKNFSDPTVNNVARREFLGRPIDGSYELTLQLDPDVDLEAIQSIQLLVDTSYWVAQNRPPELTKPRSTTSTFTPADLGNKLIAWLSPNRNVTLAGDGVAGLGDQSGRANGATQSVTAAMPTLRRSSDGLNSLLFDGQKRLDMLLSRAPDAPNRAGFAIWYRAAPGSTTCCGTLLHLQETAGDSVIRDSSASLMRVSLMPNAELATQGVDQDWHFWVFQYDAAQAPGARVLVSRDGQSQTVTPPPTVIDASASPDGHLFIGNGPTMASGLKGELGNIYVFGDLLSTSEIVQLNSFERRR